jgi:predicted glycoside hydrolase/deacetylase ChbG (UPF0249 family)
MQTIRREQRHVGPGITSPAADRHLVLHADDFGMNEAVSRGILQGFMQGLLTSTSILTNAPDVARAIAHWRDLQSRFAQHDLPSIQARQQLSDSPAPFDLGIHLNLTQGRPLTAGRYPASLLDAHGRFPGVFGLARRLLNSGWKYRAAIQRELAAQIDVLIDHAITPTHLNAHQYIDMFPVVAAIIPVLLETYSIRVVRVPWERDLTQTTLLRRSDLVPWRLGNWCLGQVKRMFAFHHLVQMTRRGVAHPAGYFGTSHAGRIDLDLMQRFISSAGRGLTEIGMHPGLAASNGTTSDMHIDSVEDGWQDPLADRRPGELELLTSPDLIALLQQQDIRLGRLSELALPALSSAAA